MKHGCLVVLCVMATLWGCGDDGDETDGTNAGGGSGGTVLGQPSGTTGMALDAAGARTTCQSIATTGLDSIGVKPLCVLGAVLTSVSATGLDVAACNTAASECEGQGGPPEDQAATDQCVGALMGCEASVDEIQACIDGGVAALSDALSKFTCEAFADDTQAEQLGMSLAGAGSVSACESLTAKCPALNVIPGS